MRDETRTAFTVLEAKRAAVTALQARHAEVVRELEGMPAQLSAARDPEAVEVLSARKASLERLSRDLWLSLSSARDEESRAEERYGDLRVPDILAEREAGMAQLAAALSRAVEDAGDEVCRLANLEREMQTLNPSRVVRPSNPALATPEGCFLEAFGRAVNVLNGGVKVRALRPFKDERHANRKLVNEGEELVLPFELAAEFVASGLVERIPRSGAN